MRKDLEQELVKMAEAHKKRRIFFEFLSRKEVWVPLIIILIILIDDPKINIVGSLVKIFKLGSGFL